MLERPISAIWRHIVRVYGPELDDEREPDPIKRGYVFVLGWLMLALITLDGMRWLRRLSRRERWRESTNAEVEEFQLPKAERWPEADIDNYPGS
jgi:hypothetical protein